MEKPTFWENINLKRRTRTGNMSRLTFLTFVL